MNQTAAVPIAVSATPSPTEPSAAAPFPPRDIAAFLAFCAGEWLALRSCFQLEGPAAGIPAAADGSANEALEDTWHSSGRGELRIAYRGPLAPGDVGALTIQPPAGPMRELQFHLDQAADGSRGTFSSGVSSGEWQLWPDGSLDLLIGDGPGHCRERIWFTKPNLRLRSSIEQAADGSPVRASFSSEIRRLPRPEAEAG